MFSFEKVIRIDFQLCSKSAEPMLQLTAFDGSSAVFANGVHLGPRWQRCLSKGVARGGPGLPPISPCLPLSKDIFANGVRGGATPWKRRWPLLNQWNNDTFEIHCCGIPLQNHWFGVYIYMLNQQILGPLIFLDFFSKRYSLCFKT